MAKGYLLDTNAVIALFNGDEQLENTLEAATHVYLSSIVIGELYYGAFKSQRQEQNLARIETFISERSILGCDENTARIYGRITNELRIAGRPVSPNDAWIAAQSIQYDLTLLTRDTDFAAISGLSLQDWKI